MKLFLEIQNSLNQFKDNNAFCINGIFYKYKVLEETVSKIRKSIRENIEENEKIIGLITNDDLETYATIIALWFEGKAYVPINTETPKERNEIIIKEAEIQTIISSSIVTNFENNKIIFTDKLLEKLSEYSIQNTKDTDLAYMLFTSGTTGIPKGVPINRENLTGIIHALNAMNLQINESDKCLQMSELTFDVSITSFLFPLLKGACVYTIPKGKIKYSYIYELMEDHQLTVVTLVPSVLNYLHKYFDEIYLPNVKYSILTAEALPINLANDWSKCVPNAKIINLYGPTENTVWSTFYYYKNENLNQSYNGMLAIGKAMYGNETIIVDEENNLLVNGEKGELCLAGTQLTTGYWKNEEKNKEAFFYLAYNNKPTRFYKTGDLCSMDKNGEILYMGRLDFQTKIQGFRVELSEIEFHIKSLLNNLNVVAVPYINKTNNTEIGLVFESIGFDTENLITFLKTKMPFYMIPSKIVFVENISLNSNGKVDRKKAQSLFE
jgi:amino acid adenylation domain-containing protein